MTIDELIRELQALVAELREFLYPSSIHWGEDYDERRGMSRTPARSA